MEEIWKDIDGFEGYYQISDKGRIKRLKRIIKVRGDGSAILNDRILKPYIGNNGYLYIDLCVNNVRKRKLIHRLVAIAFCQNPNGYDCVDHIDGSRINNNSDNLRWCTPLQNNNYPIAIQRKKQSCKKGMATKKRNVYERQLGIVVNAVAPLINDGKILCTIDEFKSVIGCNLLNEYQLVNTKCKK